MKGLGAISLWTSEPEFGFKRNYNLFPRISTKGGVNCSYFYKLSWFAARQGGSIRKNRRRNTPWIWCQSQPTYRGPYRYADQERLSGRAARDVLVPKRAYDQSYPECLKGIDAAITKLKDRGATRVVVAGFSMGGVAALAYGASHEGLAGVIAIAPAHFPDYFSKRTETAASIAKAQAMVKSGHGDNKAAFAGSSQPAGPS